MKSKEEQRRILQKNGIEQISDEDNFFKDIMKSMDEWAKQEAIAFKRWWNRNQPLDILHTTEQLYNLYLESKKQKV